MNGTYIKLYRKLLDWEWYDDTNCVRLFLHLLLKANWDDSIYKGRKIPRGSVVTGRKALSSELGMSERSLRTTIKRLTECHAIDVETTNKFSIINVCQFDTYNPDKTANDQQTTSKRPAKCQASDSETTTSKEDKNITRKEDKDTLVDLAEPNTTPATELVLSGSEKPDPKHGHCPYKQIVGLYNEILGGSELKQCKIATDSRKAAIRRTWAFFDYDAEAFNGYYRQVKESDFLCGRGKNNFQATFDWLLQQKNLIKVLEGNYNNG